MTNTNIPWIEKFRPKCLDDIMAHDNVIKSLKKCIIKNYLPHMLFYGPSGTGKTSTIMACAKELYGKFTNIMVLELNASDNRGIEVVREKIKKFVSTDSVFFNVDESKKPTFKMVILDETDAMTNDAQAILRKVMEDYTYNTRFCLICNYIQKIILSLQSRCAKFKFLPISNNCIKNKIVNICKLEKINITNDGIDTIIKRSCGDLRKAINILQSVNMIYKKITHININKCLGYPDIQCIYNILNALINYSFDKSYDYIYKIKKSEGYSLIDIINEIHNILINIILDKSNDNIFTDIKKKISQQDILIILDKMRDIDINQSIVLSDDIQTVAFIGIFNLIKKK